MSEVWKYMCGYGEYMCEFGQHMRGYWNICASDGTYARDWDCRHDKKENRET